MAINVYKVLGVPVSVTTLRQAGEAIERWAKDDQGRFICIRDVHGIMRAQSDADLMLAHQHAALVAPDGMPLVWLGRRAGHPVERTCGPDLMEHVLVNSQKSGLRHYLFGGQEGVAQRLSEVLNERFPRVSIVGTETPPFRALTDAELDGLAQRINSANADIVWVGLSTPKQELLMQRLVPLIRSTLIGVGAAFDFHLGSIRRAPIWMQRASLEWLFRFSQEPLRLWHRYLILAPKFLLLLAHERFASRKR